MFSMMLSVKSPIKRGFGAGIAQAMDQNSRAPSTKLYTDLTYQPSQAAAPRRTT
jgi:hypothetical protein